MIYHLVSNIFKRTSIWRKRRICKLSTYLLNQQIQRHAADEEDKFSYDLQVIIHHLQTAHLQIDN